MIVSNLLLVWWIWRMLVKIAHQEEKYFWKIWLICAQDKQAMPQYACNTINDKRNMPINLPNQFHSLLEYWSRALPRYQVHALTSCKRDSVSQHTNELAHFKTKAIYCSLHNDNAVPSLFNCISLPQNFLFYIYERAIF